MDTPLTTTDNGSRFRAPYAYTPLTMNGDEIRLITLLPAPNNELLIKCDIKHVLLNLNPSYIALSYAWGNSSKMLPIFLNGCVFWIRENLWVALQYLRDSVESFVIWIDAICINQSSIPERNSQVSLMDQIYRGADKVYIWLGQSTLDIDLAMKLLSHLASISREPKENVLRSVLSLFEGCPENAWKALQDVFEKSWWTRAWILQEICLASSATVVLGNYRISWELFSKFASIYTKCEEALRLITEVSSRRDCIRTSLRSSSKLFLIESIRKALGPGFKDIGMLLYISRQANATDAKDLVYSVLGIVDWGSRNERQKFDIEYAQSVAQVYIRVPELLYQSNQTVDFLSWVEEQPYSHSLEAAQMLPSWVPDWSRRGHSCPLVAFSTKDPQRPQWSPFRATLDTQAECTFELSAGILWITGFHLDCIKCQAPPCLSGMTPAKAEWRKVAELGSGALWNADGESQERIAKLDIFWRTLLAGQLSKFSGSHQIPPTSLDEALRLMRDADPDFFMPAWIDRTLIRSERGRLGLAPRDAQAGDLVCAFLGGRCLYVIRERVDEPHSYTFIGESYLHGMMNGEALQLGLEKQRLRLI